MLQSGMKFCIKCGQPVDLQSQAPKQPMSPKQPMVAPARASSSTDYATTTDATAATGYATSPYSAIATSQQGNIYKCRSLCG